MKTKLYSSSPTIFRSRMRAATLVLMGLLAGSVYGQSSSSSDPDTLRNNSSASDPSRSGTSDPSMSSGTSMSDRDASSYDRSSSRSSMGERSTGGENGLKHADKRFITKAAESSQREIALSQLAVTRATNPQIRSYAQQLVNGHQQMEQNLVQLAQSKGVVLDDVAALSTSNVSGQNNNNPSANSTSAVDPSMTSQNSSSATRSSSANPAPMGGTSDHAMKSNSGTSRTSNSVAANSDATSDRHYRSLAKKSGTEFDKEYVDMMIKEHKSDVKLFQKAANDAKDNDVRAFAGKQLPSLQAHLDEANSLGRVAAE